jgi:acyl-CoA thioester hydrolase
MAHHVFSCPLRWSDMDSYGHVNNVQYVRLLEEARVAMLFVEPKASDVLTLDGQLVVVRHEIDYQRPLVYRPEPITIETWVTHIGGASFTVAYTVQDAPGQDAEVYARAKTVLAAIDTATGHARRLRDDERTWITTYYEPDE